MGGVVPMRGYGGDWGRRPVCSNEVTGTVAGVRGGFLLEQGVFRQRKYKAV